MMRRLLLCFCLLLPAMTVSAKDSVVGSPRIHAVQNGVVVTDTMVVRDGDETVFTAVDDSGMLMQELSARSDLQSDRFGYKDFQSDKCLFRIKNADIQCGRIANPTERAFNDKYPL